MCVRQREVGGGCDDPVTGTLMVSDRRGKSLFVYIPLSIFIFPLMRKKLLLCNRLITRIKADSSKENMGSWKNEGVNANCMSGFHNNTKVERLLRVSADLPLTMETVLELTVNGQNIYLAGSAAM